MNFRQVLGTSNRRRLELIEILYYNREGVSSGQILNELDCSLPLLLSDIKLINEQQTNFIVEKEKGIYRVKFKKEISIGKVYAEALSNSSEFQIIEQLLYEQCDNILELSQSLFLSFSNAQRSLKKIESNLRVAGIQLRYRPLRLEGKESVVRHFFYRYFIEKQHAVRIVLPDLKEYQSKTIGTFATTFTEINGFNKKYIFQKRVTYNIFISLWRIKNDHPYPKGELRKTGLILPEMEEARGFRDLVSEVFCLNLTDEMMRDCLWLSFSDSIVFSKSHLAAALSDNARYKRLFTAHLKLAEQFLDLIGGAVEVEDIYELTAVLLNDTYLYDVKKGEFLTILRNSRTTFLETVKLMHRYAVEEVTKLVQNFVQENKMYQKTDYITNYVYLLLTGKVDSLELLASYDDTIRLLLISDLSPTEEEYISTVITQMIYGNFEIHHFENIWDENGDLVEKIMNYDALITTGSMEELPKGFPVVSIEPYVTPQSIVTIQKLVNELPKKKSLVS